MAKTRRAIGATSIVLCVAMLFVACASKPDPGPLIAACNLFYSHLDGSGACQGCANQAPTTCNRPGIDGKCAEIKACANQWCNGAQCQCDGFSRCMADAGDACDQALLDYYDCSNQACASVCGATSGPTCGDGKCDSGETCSTCAADCGACGPTCRLGDTLVLQTPPATCPLQCSERDPMAFNADVFCAEPNTQCCCFGGGLSWRCVGCALDETCGSGVDVGKCCK